MKFNRIRELRQASGMSIRKCAETLKIYTSKYQRYEYGESEIPFFEAIKIAKLYNVSLEYLAGLTDDPKPFQ